MRNTRKLNRNIPRVPFAPRADESDRVVVIAEAGHFVIIREAESDLLRPSASSCRSTGAVNVG
jgi:hypothetical protein